MARDENTPISSKTGTQKKNREVMNFSFVKMPEGVTAAFRKRQQVLNNTFELRKNGSIAQSVEQRIENPRVGGSNPSRATTYITG